MDIVTQFMEGAPILVLGPTVLALMAVAIVVGVILRKRQDADGAVQDEDVEGQEAYVVSAVLGLLALLMGFTFSLAVDRFETRRVLVLEESNAIGTTYLRTQLLEEPHRTRISGLLVEYTDNRIAAAWASTSAQLAPLVVQNDRLLTDLWAATSSAFLTIKGMDFSSAYLDSMNHLIDLDAARKAARNSRVPAAVFVVLIVYLIVTALVLGYVFTGRRGRWAAAFMLGLLALSLLLIIDIDRPTRGWVREDQGPMERLRASMKANPPQVYDRWRIEDAAPKPAIPPPPNGGG